MDIMRRTRAKIRAAARRRPSVFFLAPALIAAAIVAQFRNQFDNDELQHLHVVWNWIRGGVQYKDVFDNHAPLYHLFAAKFLSFFELSPSPGFVFSARLISLIFFLGFLTLAASLLKRIFRLRTPEAATAACLLGISTPFLALMARPEGLWLLLFFANLYLLSSAKFDNTTAFLTGLLTGAGASVSLKTVVILLPAQAAASAAYFLLYRKKPVRGFLPLFLAGFAIVPGAIAVYFQRLGALDELIRYTVFFNLTAPGTGLSPHKLAFAGVAAAAGVLLCLALRRREVPAPAFIFITSAAALGTLISAFPVVEHQTVLPFRLMAYLLGWGIFTKALSGRRAEAPAGIIAFFLILGWQARAMASESNVPQKKCLDAVLRLAGDQEYVMDAKGEAIFPRRPVHYSLELFTQRRIAAGLMPDDIPEKLRETATKLVLLWYVPRFTSRDLAFIYSNYLPLASAGGGLLAAGKTLYPGRDGKARFALDIPAEYKASCDDGSGVILDGSRDGNRAVYLPPGPHLASARSGCREIRLIWAKAAGERTY